MPLTNGNPYSYAIFVYDAAGNWTCKEVTAVVPAISLSAPVLQELVPGDGTLTVRWDKVMLGAAYSDSYTIHWGWSPLDLTQSRTVTDAQLVDRDAPEWTLTTADDGIENYTTYWVTVHATYGLENSAQSNMLSKAPAPPSAIFPPLNLAVLAGDQAFRLVWDEDTSHTSYEVYYGSMPGTYDGTASPIAVSGNRTSFDVTVVEAPDLVNDQLYFISVKAFVGAVGSELSDEVMVVPQAGIIGFEAGGAVMALEAGYNIVGIPYETTLAAGAYAQSIDPENISTVYWIDSNTGRYVGGPASAVSGPVTTRMLSGQDALVMNSPDGTTKIIHGTTWKNNVVPIPQE